MILAKKMLRQVSHYSVAPQSDSYLAWDPKDIVTVYFMQWWKLPKKYKFVCNSHDSYKYGMHREAKELVDQIKAYMESK